MTLKALIFDVDGTLADTEEAHRRAFNEAFAQHGLDWNWSKSKYAHLLETAGGKERIAAYVDTLPLDVEEKAPLKNLVADIHRTKTLMYTRMVVAGEVRLRDGVERLLDETLRSGVKLAIASTTTFTNIEALLTTSLGPDALLRFSTIGAGDQVKHKKPAPDIYALVLHGLHEKAENCVAFEDSANGLESAKRAGIYTVVTPSYWTQTEDFSAADLVLPSLGTIAKPLPLLAAALIGNKQLGVRELERLLSSQQSAKRATERSITGGRHEHARENNH